LTGGPRQAPSCVLGNPSSTNAKTQAERRNAATSLAQIGDAPAADAAGRKVESKIRSFESGDNCYLTIITPKGVEIVGLCAAPQCAPWNENVAMPRKMIGVRVTATMDGRHPLDGSGNDMGAFTAFTSLTIKR